MSQDTNGKSRDEIIHNYLENQATPAEEKQFRLLLGERSFCRRVAEYSIDFGYLHDQGCRGMLERTLTGQRKSVSGVRRQVFAGAVVAATLLLAVGVWWCAFSGKESSRGLAQPQTEPQPREQPDEREVIGHVVAVTGKVLMARCFDSTDVRRVKDEAELRSGDMVRTGETGGFAHLRFFDDSVVSIAGGTTLTCSVVDFQKRIDIRGGDIMAQVNAQPVEKPVIIMTPTAEAEVLGTRLSVFANLQLTELNVLEGHVLMCRRSDGEAIDVKAGQTAIASADAALAAEPILPVASLWQEDFEQGLPGKWESGSWISDGLPDGSLGAVRAAVPARKQDKANPQYFVASSREWWRGLFRIEYDTHLNFTYTLRKQGWFNVMVETRTDDSDRAFSGTFLYKNPKMWTGNPTRWRTVSVPLQAFRDPPRAKVRRGSPAVGDLAYRFYFSTQESNPGLTIDRIWVTGGAPDSAKVLGPWK